MLKLIHVPQEILKTVQQWEALHSNNSSDSYVISFQEQQAYNINFTDENDIHITEPVKKRITVSRPG